MKNVLKTLLVFSILSTVFVSCSDNEIAVNEKSTDLSEPLAYNQSLEGMTSSFDLESLTLPAVKNEAAATNRSCPAEAHAWAQLQDIQPCPVGDLYCYYLEVFWRIDLDVAKINCYGCNNNICVTNAIEYSVAIDDLRALHLPRVYIFSLIAKLQLLINACNVAC